MMSPVRNVCFSSQRSISFPDLKSFNQVPKWVEDVRAERGNEAIIVLVGNKTDMVDRRRDLQITICNVIARF